MTETVASERDSLLAERRSIVSDDAGAPIDYLGATDPIIDATLDRAQHFLGEPT